MKFKNLLLILILNQTYIFCADLKENAEQNAKMKMCSVCDKNPHDINKHFDFIMEMFDKKLYKDVLRMTSELLLLLPKDKYKECSHPQYTVPIREMLHTMSQFSRILLFEDPKNQAEFIFEYYNFALRTKNKIRLKGILSILVCLGFNKWEYFEQYYLKREYQLLKEQTSYMPD